MAGAALGRRGRSCGARGGGRIPALASLLARGSRSVGARSGWSRRRARRCCRSGVLESAAAFLLLRVLLVPAVVAVVEVSELAGAASDEAAFLLFFVDFLDAVLLVAAEVSEAGSRGVSRSSLLALFLTSWPERPGSIGGGGLIAGRAGIRCRLRFTSFSSWQLRSLLGRRACLHWGLAMADIPVSRENMQSVIVHVLSLDVQSVHDFLSFRAGLDTRRKLSSRVL